MKKLVAIILLVLSAVCGSLYLSLMEVVDECERLRSNQRALMDDVTLYRNKLGESVASVERLELTKKELEQNYASMCEEARVLGIKVRRLQSTSVSAMSTEIKAETDVYSVPVNSFDSFLFGERNDSCNSFFAENLGSSGKDTVQVFEWRDPPWASVSGVIDDRSVTLNVHCVDTLVQIVHRVPKKFLFFRFGTKAIRQEVVSKNPYTKVIYTEYIELKK